MFHPDESTRALTEAIVRYAVWRINLDPPPLDGPRSPARAGARWPGRRSRRRASAALEALRVFADVLAPACISVDHPRFLSFVPAAPTDASILFDLVVGASSIYGGSWLEGGGAVFAENEALRWIADLAGLPATAGGRVRQRRHVGQPERADRRPVALAAAGRRHARPHPRAAAGVRRGPLLRRPGGAGDGRRRRDVPADELRTPDDAGAAIDGRRTRPTTSASACSPSSPRAARPTPASSTTSRAAADVAAELGTWLHVDGAYGGAALAAPSVRDRFDGIEAADSFIVDPHKWLFAPFDSCALLYRDPEIGPPGPHPARRVPRRAPRRAATQRGRAAPP